MDDVYGSYCFVHFTTPNKGKTDGHSQESQQLTDQKNMVRAMDKFWPCSPCKQYDDTRIAPESYIFLRASVSRQI
jgi:hypothetical protein